jgi:hypothetical protein
MNRPPDDEYGSLRDLLGGGPYDDPSDGPGDESHDGQRPAGDSPGDSADTDTMDVPLPEMHAEYAEAYRRGYERARRGEEETQRIDVEALAAVRASASGGAPASSSARVPADSSVRVPVSSSAEPERGRDGRVLLVVLAALALLVVVAAFGIGRLFAADEGGSTEAQGERTGGGHAGQSRDVYTGAVEGVTIADAMATCQTDNSVDAAGNPTTYEPAKAYDSDLTTAWRCNGSGVGQRFTITLPDETKVAEVGLVPGYAKTDPVNGVDRYAENNRITKVRWHFDDGTTFVQRMGGDPHNRKMRTIRLPETSTRKIVLEILASQPGPRNTVAISELRVATPRG